METELQDHLFACGTAYAAAKSLELSTVGRLSAADGAFFERLKDGKTFTARKYDTVMAWFASNWPEGLAWPEGAPRPAVAA